ncbi:glycosyltransferase family 4 protein [Pseudomonas monteilii]|uniref:glycosyltransferase family 4 protein n=1 Tax=Pseudomonas monteilii TaxID=76759 RepID=UPI001E5F54F6|nr:glycosyltransferase family 4 protein [Pseudomonas monteilii]MCE1037803.1 glycosyltransferase family 4 protein [Pseudomonas monteilii]
MKKIAMIVWNEFLNDARVLKEAQTLQHAGYQVRVFALHTPGITPQQERLEDGVEVFRVARSPLWRMRKRKITSTLPPQAGKNQGPIGKLGIRHQVLRLIARAWTHTALLVHMVRYGASVVHSHDVNTLPTAWLAPRISRARLVYDAHEISTSREGYDSFRRLVGMVEKRLMPAADGTITTTDARAKYFARAYHVKRPTVLQNRPRLTRCAPTNRIREELGLTEPWPIVIYQGGLQQGRGLEKLIRTTAKVPDAYFVLIGGGRLAHNLNQLIEELELQDRVRIIPTVPLSELPSYTASADIGVQPIENTCLNHYTTDSNKLFEYIIAGLPVVATDFPEIRRIVRRHDVGLLVPSDDPTSLAHALNVLVSDANLREAYAQNASSTAATLNWEQQESRLVDLYQQVLSSAPHSSQARS